MSYSITPSHCFSVYTVLFPQTHSVTTLLQPQGRQTYRHTGRATYRQYDHRQSHLQTIQPQISQGGIKMCLWQQNSVRCKAMDQNDHVNCCVHNSPGDAWTEWWRWQQEKYVWVRGHQHYTAKPAVQMVRGKLVLKQNGVREGPGMEHMAKNLKGCTVGCGQWLPIYLSDAPEVWQIHKMKQLLCKNTGLPRLITMAQLVTPCFCKFLIGPQTPEAQGLKLLLMTSIYKKTLQKT